MTAFFVSMSLAATTIGFVVGYAVGRTERPRAHTLCAVCRGPIRDHGEQ